MCVIITVVVILLGAWYGARQIDFSLPRIEYDEGYNYRLYYISDEDAHHNKSLMTHLWNWAGRALHRSVPNPPGHLDTVRRHVLTWINWLDDCWLWNIIVVLCPLLLIIVLATRCWKRRRENTKNASCGAMMSAESRFPFVITQNRSSSRLANEVSASERWAQRYDEDDDSYPTRPRTLHDLFGSEFGQRDSSPDRQQPSPTGDVLAGAWRQLAAVRVIQRWIRTRFQPWLQNRQPLQRGGPSEPTCELFYEDHIVPPTNDKNADVGAGDVLVGAWRQLAAARVIQRWIRTRFQPWLQKCQPLRRGGPSEPACELFYEDHIGPPTIEKNLDVGTGDVLAGARRQLAAVRVIQRWIRTMFKEWMEKRQPLLRGGPFEPMFECFHEDHTVPPTNDKNIEFGMPELLLSTQRSCGQDMTGDVLTKTADLEGVETGAGSTPCHLVEGKDQRNDVDEKTSKRVELNRPGGDSIWFRLKTPYPWPSAADSADWEWTSSNTLPSQLSEEAETADFSSSIGDQLSIERLSTPLLHAPAKNVLATPSEKAFGELLRECKHATPMTFDAVLEDIGAEGCVKLHEGGVYSEVFRTCGSRGAAVLKVLHPGYLHEHLQQLLTEVRVARILRKMSMNVDNNTGGFAELRVVYAVWDKYPYMMRNACINYHSRKNFSLFGDEERDTSKPYVVMYMSFAGRPLSKVQFASTLQIRSVVQQLALTIAIGETALEFEHRALTPAHVLVKEAHDQVAAFWLDGRPLLVDMFGVQVTVVDFSTARLKPPSEDSQALFADLTKLSEEKWVSLGDSFATAYSMIRGDLSQFYPWTNMVYLEALTRMLVKTHEGRFASAADEAERQAWRDVCFWLGEMPHYGTTRDFARELIVQSARSTTSLSSL